MKPATRNAWWLTLFGYLGTLLLITLWYSWLAPLAEVPIAMSLLAFGGLLILPLRGMLQGRVYTVSWSLFISIAYFTHGVVEAWSAPALRTLAFTEIGLSLIWFVSGIAYVRASKAETT